MDQLIKKDHSQQAISDQALSENVKVCYDRFRKKCGLIRKGITTENNVKPYFLEIKVSGTCERIVKNVRTHESF